jgi:hypothetical protein
MWQGLLLPAAFFLTASCSSLHVPVRGFEIPSQELWFSSHDGVSIGARAIISRDLYWDLFDDNLPAFGIGAIWVEVRNESESVLDMSSVHWILDGNPAGPKELDSSSVLDRYYKMRNVRMVSLEEERKSRVNLEFVRFPSVRIPSGSRRHGFLFFRTNPSESENWARGSLRAEQVRDSQGRILSIQVSLANANP